ncbi:GNAT family N-acetyltransferase [Chitinophaga sp. Mgbs1]|uniref:GNAT family N-acetyltransferase n=1 Tax=Chitinophaga solisilvae TaxID=1233460 RepID=A0A3S1CTG4_9BACT|nr:GNAT family N-acetyltransferase [Chitinophaga solisilvae]
MQISIRVLSSERQTIADLSDMMIAVVAHGGSIGFMHPLAQQVAEGFWQDSLLSAEKGERIVLGAFDNDILAGTVTLLLKGPQNQPHRGEIAKMMTRAEYRRRGIARALLLEAERLAAAHGRTLLTLDTATEDGAAGLYESLGYQLTGEIPDYALKPHGGLTGTLIYWKRL